MVRPITQVFHGKDGGRPYVERSAAYLLTGKIVFQVSQSEMLFREATEIIGDEAHLYEDKPYRMLVFDVTSRYGDKIAKKLDGAQLAEMSFVEVVERLISE